MTMTHLLRPSRTASGNALAHLGTALDKRIREARARRQMRKMLNLDDHMLRDLGLTRGDIRTATRMPMSVDAATELHRISLYASRLHV